MTTLFTAETSMLHYAPRLIANNLLFIMVVMLLCFCAPITMPTLTASTKAFFFYTIKMFVIAYPFIQ